MEAINYLFPPGRRWLDFELNDVYHSVAVRSLLHPCTTLDYGARR